MALNASQLPPTHRPDLGRFETAENIAVVRPLVLPPGAGEWAGISNFRELVTLERGVEAARVSVLLASGAPGKYAVIMDQAILEREALRLPAHQRALLADTLLESLDDEAARKVELAWADEAESRLAAYHRGELSALDGPAVFRELRDRHAK